MPRPVLVLVDGNPSSAVKGQRSPAPAEGARKRQEEATFRNEMKRIHVGSRVRIADGAILNAQLRLPADLRPEAGQMLWAGREASVTGYCRGPEDRSLYTLKGAPGLWLGDWIDPI